jgi:hypothetical protein
MAKDYTDYVALVLEAKKRVYHVYHLRASKSQDKTEIEHNNRQYVFDRDRAFRVKWAPWQKFDRKRPWMVFHELLRSKKVGLLLYHEPTVQEPKYKEVKEMVPKEYVCKVCGFTTVHDNGIKTHLRNRHKLKEYGKNIRVSFDVKTTRVPYFEPILPFHISRVHQPSGELRP